METTSTTSSTGYKGKVLRSWSQLPPEIIRLIATHYLHDISTYAYVPQTYDPSEFWPRRMAYTVLRDAPELEKLMSICPTWGSALENHNFWEHACHLMDPNDVLLQHRFIQTTASTGGSNTNSSFIRLSLHRHFRNMYRYSCIVCRINYPWYNNGLTAAKRLAPTAYLGCLPVCREHRKASFCGLCLRDTPAHEVEAEYSYVCCVENDDEETWPGIDATCRSCRIETLWKIAGRQRGDREALGGSSFESPDWETRQAVESFIEMGEGTIHDVLNTAREKYWMRKHTKLADMLSQALAANRYTSRTEAGEVGYVSDEDMSDEEEEDSELLSLTEDSGGVKELAMLDWARSRILDGYWISPYDHWDNLIPYGRECVPTEHPCPWNKGATFTGALEEGETEADGEGLSHPRPKTVAVPQPPTESLSEYGHKAYLRAMHSVLSPAMRNLVRKIVIECTADGVDPALKASRLTLEDVVSQLRDEAMWFNGIDWLERRANRVREDAARGTSGSTDEDDCSSSSRSDGSHTTSPVLSTATLQTTPSPPPSGDAVSKEDDNNVTTSLPTSTATTVTPAPSLPSSTPVIPIPVAPVLKSPTLIHPVPYIPVTISHLPRHSYSIVWAVWREAVAPLFQCRCSICERMMLKLNIASGNIIPTQSQDTTTAQPQQAVPDPAYQYQPPQKPVEIQLDEAISRGVLTVLPEFQPDETIAETPVKDSKQYRESFRGRAQTPGPESRKRPALAEEEEETEDEDSIIDFEGSESEAESPSLPTVAISDKSLPVTPRKRPSQELDGEALEKDSFLRTGSPPKRLRVDGTYSPIRVATPPLTPSKKRSSEELDDGDENARSSPTGDVKRLRSSASGTERLDGIRAIKTKLR